LLLVPLTVHSASARLLREAAAGTRSNR
jgi:hypothetical protein